MPTTIAAATASAISRPLPVWMQSFFGSSGMHLDRADGEPALPKPRALYRVPALIHINRHASPVDFATASSEARDCRKVFVWEQKLTPPSLFVASGGIFTARSGGHSG